MADMTNARELYLADLRAQRDKLDQMIAMIEGFGGTANGGGAASSGAPEGPNIGRHDFVGMATPEATKRFLRRIGQRLASPHEIAAALIQGGQSTQEATTVYTNVYSALKRLRASGEVVKQGQEWGLAEVFPALAKKQPKTSKDRGDVPEIDF